MSAPNCKSAAEQGQQQQLSHAKATQGQQLHRKFRYGGINWYIRVNAVNLWRRSSQSHAMSNSLTSHPSRVVETAIIKISWHRCPTLHLYSWYVRYAVISVGRSVGLWPWLLHHPGDGLVKSCCAVLRHTQLWQAYVFSCMSWCPVRAYSCGERCMCARLAD